MDRYIHTILMFKRRIHDLGYRDGPLQGHYHKLLCDSIALL